MKLISFDALRTLKLNGVRYIKPEEMSRHSALIQESDGVLFPEYWQLNTLVFALKRRVFPSLASYLIGHNKVEMTRCFQALTPANVPFTMIGANTPEMAARIWDAMPSPFVAKIPKSSMGNGVFLIETRQQWQHYQSVTDTLYAQEYLPIDRDIRIVWVGRKIVGCYWRLQADQGFYNNIAQGGYAVAGPVPASARALVKTLATSLGIDHGGFDIAMVDDHPFIFEFNRLFGTRGVGGMDVKIDKAIAKYLQENWGSDKPRSPTIGVAA